MQGNPRNTLSSLYVNIYKITEKILSYFIKLSQNPNQLIVGFGGEYYNGNLKSVYSAISFPNNQLRPKKTFWVTSNSKTRKELDQIGIKNYHKYDIRHIPLFLKTNIWFSDHGTGDIPIKKRNSSLWIQLWHGIPFKGFENSTKTTKEFNQFDLHPVSSHWLANYYEEAIKVKKEKIYVSGYPRSDDLINNLYDVNQIMKKKGFNDFQKIILYAPTWAHESKKIKPLFPWNKDREFIENLDLFLKKNKLLFLIRTHPNWNGPDSETKEYIYNTKNIEFQNFNEEQDANKLLVISDILITDYSSIANDFIVLNRPIIFLDPHDNLFQFGFALTKNERAGIIVQNAEEMFDAIISSRVDPKKNEALRKDIIKKIHYKLDGNASLRVLQKIKEMIIDKIH